MVEVVSVPPFPESVTEAQVARWHRREGEMVKPGEPLVDLETDKVVLEVPAPKAGVLTKILKPEGTAVTSGEPLAEIEPKELPAEKETPPTAPKPEESQATPSARRMIEALGLEERTIPGSGPEGRITKRDVERFLETRKETAPPVEERPAEPSPELGIAPKLPETPPGKRLEERVPMSPIRKRIAERLLEVQRQTAPLTTFNEADMGQVLALRKRYNPLIQERFGFKLGIVSFFVKAAVEALKRFPILNARIEGEEIVYCRYYDIGIAVATERGLVVPVLRDADKRSLIEIEREIDQLALQARSGKIPLEALQGGTFTITNGGVFGSLLSTPLLNPPQSAILGLHAIQKRPVVVDDRIEIRPMMFLALTYDHRLIDGREAILFLRTVKELIEAPERIWLGV